VLDADRARTTRREAREEEARCWGGRSCLTGRHGGPVDSDALNLFVRALFTFQRRRARKLGIRTPPRPSRPRSRQRRTAFPLQCPTRKELGTGGTSASRAASISGAPELAQVPAGAAALICSAALLSRMAKKGERGRTALIFSLAKNAT